MTIDQLSNDYQKGYTYTDCAAIYDRHDAVFKKGRIHIDFGRTGEGKTTIITQRCLAFAAGLPFGDIFPFDAIPNIQINLEQTKEDFNRRYLQKFFENVDTSSPIYKRIQSNYEFYDSSIFGAIDGDHSKTISTVVDTLEKVIKRFRQDRGIDTDRLIMLTLDPACILFSKELGTGANAISYVVKPLTKLSLKLNVAIVLVCHAHRARENKLLELADLQGSHALAATVDSVFAIESPFGKADPARQIRCLKGELVGKYCETITQTENSFFGLQVEHISPYEHRAFRTLPPTKSKDLYALLGRLFPELKTSREIEYAIRTLVRGGIIHKEEKKNVYRGLLNGQTKDSKSLKLEEMIATDKYNV
jgi:RecA-family ATPase